MEILRIIVEAFSWAFIDFIYWPIFKFFGGPRKANKWFLRELEENVEKFSTFSILSKEYKKMRELSSNYYIPVFNSKGIPFAMRRQKFLHWLINDNKAPYEHLETRPSFPVICPTFKVTKDTSDDQTSENAKKLRAELSTFIVSIFALGGTKLIIDLDGAFGYSTKFLRELFGNLIQELPYSTSALQYHLQIKCSDEPSLEKEVENLIFFGT